MLITYSSSVKVDAGWRHVTIQAEAARVSPGMAKVVCVVAIDGEPPKRGMSRTGARRQEFDGTWWASREIGARKRLSSCEVEGE